VTERPRLPTGSGQRQSGDRAARLLAALAAAPLLSCGSDPTAPGPVPEGRLATLTEYLFAAPQVKQRGTYRYDRRGRFVRFEFVSIEELATGPVETMTYLSNHFYSGDRRTGGEVLIRRGDEFVKSREWTYGYDAAGRLDRLTLTTLLAGDFTPIRETGTETYGYDDRDRVDEVQRANGDRWRFFYDAGGDLAREELHTTDGTVISFEHTYDDRTNPFYRMWGHGLIVVVAPWALMLSPHNVIRTETRVAGRDGVVSYREVHINSYTLQGTPLQWIQRLVNTADPDDPTSFVAEFTYGGESD
jgi:hypothetical protein